MERNIYDYALELLNKRENYHSAEAHKSESHTVAQCHLSEASAYNSAWWILYHAKNGNWESLQQFDYLN